MRANDIIVLGLLGIGLLCGFILIFMTFYLGRRKIKEIDRLVFGYEIGGDSIFYQGIRLMNYGGAFAWRWSAKRAHILEIREHFDKKFQRPFIIHFWLVWISVGFSILALLSDKYFSI